MSLICTRSDAGGRGAEVSELLYLLPSLHETAAGSGAWGAGKTQEIDALVTYTKACNQWGDTGNAQRPRQATNSFSRHQAKGVVD